jgi:hypothetical protein
VHAPFCHACVKVGAPTATGWRDAQKKYPQPDLLEDEELSLAGRVAMVTGANSGIGKEIAQFLVRRGK